MKGSETQPASDFELGRSSPPVHIGHTPSHPGAEDVNALEPTAVTADASPSPKPRDLESLFHEDARGDNPSPVSNSGSGRDAVEAGPGAILNRTQPQRCQESHAIDGDLGEEMSGPFTRRGLSTPRRGSANDEDNMPAHLSHGVSVDENDDALDGGDSLQGLHPALHQRAGNVDAGNLDSGTLKLDSTRPDVTNKYLGLPSAEDPVPATDDSALDMVYSTSCSFSPEMSFVAAVVRYSHRTVLGPSKSFWSSLQSELSCAVSGTTALKLSPELWLLCGFTTSRSEVPMKLGISSSRRETEPAETRNHVVSDPPGGDEPFPRRGRKRRRVEADVYRDESTPGRDRETGGDVARARCARSGAAIKKWTPLKLKRLQAYRKEGMPWEWIAEQFGGIHTPEAVRTQWYLNRM